MIFRLSLALLFAAFCGLQYKAWFGDVGYVAGEELRREVDEQRRRTDVLRQRNRLLTAEVLALQEGPGAVEARARSNLGMIKQGETFYLVSDSLIDDRGH